jgi:hypothetical protein
MIELQIPPQCVSCPTLCEIQSDLQNVDMHKRIATELAVSDKIPEILRQELRESVGMPEDIASEVVDESMVDVRKQFAEALNEVDDNESFLVGAAEAIFTDCSGKLRMRAKTRAGRMIMVTVCGSNAVPAGFQHEPVHVEREKRR